MKILSILITYLLLMGNVEAKTFTYEDLKLDVNGYLGYKYITSTAEDHVNNSEPELGLALSLQMTENLSAYTQFEYAPEIDNAMVYSFLSYDYMINDDWQIGFKGGKLRHDFALYNAGRVNPRTRQGVIMPQAIYWDSLRYLIISGVGINFNVKFKNLELTYTIDKPEIVDPKDEARVWSSILLSEITTSFGSHQLATIKYTFDDFPLMLKGTWTNINLGNKNTPITEYVFPGYGNADQDNHLFNIGFELGTSPVIFSAETMLVKPFYADWNETDRWSYGMSYTIKYEATENIMLYSNYNYYYSNNAGKVPVWYKNTNDISVGVNYHQDAWQISAEVHQIKGGRWVHPDDWKNDPESYQEWYMVGVNAVYFF